MKTTKLKSKALAKAAGQAPKKTEDGRPMKAKNEPAVEQTSPASTWNEASVIRAAKNAILEVPSAEPTAPSAALVALGETTRADAAIETSSPHPAGDIGLCPFHNAVNRGDPEKLRQVAVETIRDKVFGDDSLSKAEKVLITALQADPADAQGKTNHLLGVVAFRQEQWGDAAKYLEIANKRNPNDPDIADLLARSRTNVNTRVDRAMGPAQPFNKERLLESPTLQLREPEGVTPIDKKTLAERIAKGFQNAVEQTRGMTARVMTNIGVALAGDTEDKTKIFEFQNWDGEHGEVNPILGEARLGFARNRLDSKLQNNYDGPVGFQRPGQVKPEWTNWARTATGAWTTNEPMEGAAGTEFQGSATNAIDRVNRAEDPSLPSAREVSRVILQAEGERTTVPFLNNLAIAWIQFENHDWVSHGPVQSDGAYEIKLAPDDPYRKKYGMDTLSVPKTAANVLPQPGKLTHLNEVTHWWDGSQIYGSDQETQDRLRTGADGKMLPGGKLRIDGDLLPINPETGIEDSGFTRNWWVGLDMFHVLFVKNHNSIAEMLAKNHPDWSSDRIFEVARLNNAAQMVKVHTEWTKAVLPNQKLVNGMNANLYGAEEALLHDEGERKIVRKFEPKDAVAGGLMGGKTNNHGVPYALTEEFTEVYRLHAGMLEKLGILPIGAAKAFEEVTAEATRGAGARDMVEKFGMNTLFNSFGNQKMTALVNNNYPAFMNDTSIEGSPVADLGTIDILRARERGVPPYNEFRRKLGLNPINSFADLGCDAKTVAKLESLYGTGPEGVEKMDLLAGTLCEARRPESFGFGETLFTIFIQMASRRIEADPFLTEKYDAEHYTQEGLDRTDAMDCKALLLEHFPELRKTGLVTATSAFEPWSSTPQEAPDEHRLQRLDRYAKPS